MSAFPNPDPWPPAPDLYLLAAIARHRVPEGLDSTPYRIRRQLEPLLRQWAGSNLESVIISGSYAKGTAIRNPSLFPTDVDVDLFLSLSPDTPGPLNQMHPSLAGFLTRHVSLVTDCCVKNVSLRIRWDQVNVDLTPARRRPSPPRQVAPSHYHTLWQTRTSTWLQTNIDEQIRYVRHSGLLNEILALKIWTRRHALYFPSFHLELATIQALSASPRLPLSASFLHLLHFLAKDFPAATLRDPANSNNTVSDLLTPEQKFRISHTAQMSLLAPTWPEIL